MDQNLKDKLARRIQADYPFEKVRVEDEGGRLAAKSGSAADLEEVSVACCRLSTVCLDMGCPAEARTYYEKHADSSEPSDAVVQEESSRLDCAVAVETAYVLFQQRKYDEAIAIFRETALQGDPEGQYWLGYCYRFGRGTEQNAWQAVKWFRKSSEQGNANAQYYLGICYYMGQAVPQDYSKAFMYASLAASQGHADALAHVAEYYFAGRCVEKNRELAMELLEKAACMGSDYARVRLNMERGQIDLSFDNDVAEE